MRRAYLIASLAAAAVTVALLVPAAAFAGTYTWSMPADFTATGGGANPDHDHYGGTPWSYLDGTTLMGTFGTGIRGGLTGWSTSGDSSALVGVNATGSTINNGGDSFPAGQAVLAPGAHPVAIEWIAPAAGAFSITGTVQPDGADLTCLASSISWSLNVNGTPKQTTSPIAQTLTLNAGDKVDLVANPTLLGQPCDVASATLQIQHTVGAPSITLDSPANGAVISGGQPTFAGKADTGFGTSAQVTIKVYSGASASGTPLRTLHTTRGSDGGYSVPIDSPMPDGDYTAQAEQSDLLGQTGHSRASTFTLHNAPPTITLNSPGTKPLLTATPTFTGKASTGAGDSTSVALLIYPGSDTKLTPVRFMTSTRDASGHFSVKVTPGLPDGQYTALAAQNGSTKLGTSNPARFRIKVHPPALTLSSPAQGAHVSNQAPTFSGAAGNSLGDSSQVTVILYAGSRVKGKPLGSVHVTRTTGSWSAVWPGPLKVGFYTVIAKQSDDAGHTTSTPAHTFQIIPGPSAIGKSITLARRGTAMAALTLTCLAPATETCTGNVLVLSSKSYRPVASGPSGQLRVLFAYVTVPGSKTIEVRQQVSPEVARVLRRHAPLKVTISADLSTGSGSPLRYSATRTLRLGS